MASDLLVEARAGRAFQPGRGRDETAGVPVGAQMSEQMPELVERERPGATPLADGREKLVVASETGHALGWRSGPEIRFGAGLEARPSAGATLRRLTCVSMGATGREGTSALRNGVIRGVTRACRPYRARAMTQTRISQTTSATMTRLKTACATGIHWGRSHVRIACSRAM